MSEFEPCCRSAIFFSISLAFWVSARDWTAETRGGEGAFSGVISFLGAFWGEWSRDARAEIEELRCCEELRDRAGESTVAALAIDRRLSIMERREPGREEPGSLLAGAGGFIALPVAFGAGIADWNRVNLFFSLI